MRTIAILTTALLISGAVRAAEPDKQEVEEVKRDIEQLRKALKNAGQAPADAASKDENADLKKQVEGLHLALTEALKMAAAAQSVFKKGQVLSVIKVTTSKEDADVFVKAFTESPKASHKMRGFRGLAVAENVKQPGSFMVISLWDDEESLNAYVSSKGFGDDHEKTGQIKSANVEPPGRFVVKEN